MNFEGQVYFAIAVIFVFTLFLLFAGGCAFQEIHGDCTVKMERTVICKDSGHVNTAIGASP